MDIMKMSGKQKFQKVPPGVEDPVLRQQRRENPDHQKQKQEARAQYIELENPRDFCCGTDSYISREYARLETPHIPQDSRALALLERGFFIEAIDMLLE